MLEWNLVNSKFHKSEKAVVLLREEVSGGHLLQYCVSTASSLGQTAPRTTAMQRLTAHEKSHILNILILEKMQNWMFGESVAFLNLSTSNLSVLVYVPIFTFHSEMKKPCDYNLPLKLKAPGKLRKKMMQIFASRHISDTFHKIYVWKTAWMKSFSLTFSTWS